MKLEERIDVVVTCPYERLESRYMNWAQPLEFGLPAWPDAPLRQVMDMLWADQLLRQYRIQIEEDHAQLPPFSEYIWQPSLWHYVMTDLEGNRLDLDKPANTYGTVGKVFRGYLMAASDLEK